MTAAPSATVAASTLLLGLALGSEPSSPHQLKPEDALEFARDVRPILSDNCFHCHGPDPATRKAGLRLDTPEGAAAALASGGHAVVPGNPEDSELVYRIAPLFDEEIMPPERSGKSLTPEEVQTLTRWVNDGARWDEHWSFRSPELATPPLVDGEKAADPIDAFIAEGLDHVGLEMQAEAEPLSLLRRVSLDLNGLPPTAEERATFLASIESDGLDHAFEAAVDRLLASPRYGVHMARPWLDAARYADTHGLHLDNRRSMWPYRDWVVSALNANMPFDEFTVAQLAGDLLPNATQADQIASGFNRCNPTSAEGGMITEEYLSIYAKDRVDTTATVWLGLTLACAQCHDHKFDPLSQRDYYGMYAFFNSLDEEATDKNIPNPKPFVAAMSPAATADLERMERLEADLEAELSAPNADLDAAASAWIDARTEEVTERWSVAVAARASSTAGVDLAIDPDSGEITASGPNPDTPVYEVELEFPGGAVDALRLDALVPEGQKLPGRGTSENFVLTYLEAESAPLDGSQPFRPVEFREVVATYSQPKFPVTAILDPDRKTGWAGGGLEGERSALLLPSAPIDHSSGVRLRIRLHFSEVYKQHTLARFRFARRLGDGTELAPADALLLSTALVPERAPTAEVEEQLSVLARRTLDPDWARALAGREAIQADLVKFHAGLPTTMVSREREERRTARLQMRGAYDQLGDVVEPATPSILPPLDPNGPADRLALAHWIVARNHPLTARVWVNRAWQHFFGSGIVATPEDFGSQGAWPSHPELLDWLAVTFMDEGWDMKAMHRRMVLTQAYRQGASRTLERDELDPEGALISHGPRFRLDGEVLRDQALFLAGILDEGTGGAGVFPYQPDGVWFAVGYSRSNTVRYAIGPPEDQTRRSLYTFWKRTAPPPNLTTFDAPMRDICTVKRERTNTPLQALVMLNDPTYVEAAKFIAARILEAAQGSNDPAGVRTSHLFEHVAGRPGTPDEIATLDELWNDLEAGYRADPDAASALLDVGLLEMPETMSAIDPAALAAGTLVASTLLNLDEVLTKD